MLAQPKVRLEGSFGDAESEDQTGSEWQVAKTPRTADSSEAGSQDAPTGFALRDRGDFIAVLANGPARADATRMIHVAAQLPMPVDVVGLLTPGDSDYPGVGAFLRSDHAHFWFRGIPALFVTDTADFRNHHYHTPDDQPDTDGHCQFGWR